MENKKNKIIGLVLILASIFTAVIFFEISVRINQNYLKSSLTPDSAGSLIPDPVPVTEEPITASISFFDCIENAFYDLGLCFRRCDASNDGGFFEELVNIACTQGCYNIFFGKSALCAIVR